MVKINYDFIFFVYINNFAISHYDFIFAECSFVKISEFSYTFFSFLLFLIALMNVDLIWSILLGEQINPSCFLIIFATSPFIIAIIGLPEKYMFEFSWNSE